MEPQDDDLPPYAKERIAAVGKALLTAFPLESDKIPEPIVSLMLELAREDSRAGERDRHVDEPPADATAFQNLLRRIKAFWS